MKDKTCPSRNFCFHNIVQHYMYLCVVGSISWPIGVYEPLGTLICKNIVVLMEKVELVVHFCSDVCLSVSKPTLP